MAITNTDRFGLTLWSIGDDDFTREQMTGDHQSLGDDAALFLSGTSATPPTAAVSNTKAFYWDKTNGVLFYRGDTLGVNPAAWTQIHPVLPAGHVHADLQPLSSELSSLASITTLGFISKTGAASHVGRTISVTGSGLSITNGDGVAGNPIITIASATAATASTIALRDGSGRIQVGTPSATADATTKSYVDTADALKANSADVYTKTDLHNAKLYQYANEGGGTGTALPSSGTRTTPRIYVQSTEPSSVGAITGDIWFEI